MTEPELKQIKISAYKLFLKRLGSYKRGECVDIVPCPATPIDLTKLFPNEEDLPNNCR